ncbi:MAG: 23S rRNA (guanosine(2251)-2'-O)-methyltransferase RlmB [Coriobacteriia bacterium]|nr:23S rRNA (guanosine(2251)-2'-O)-methyltransferase RlmB [Coriobacteriia bacterium]
MLLEGKHAVAEALRAGVPLTSVSIAAGAKREPLLDEIVRLSAAAGVPVDRLHRRELDCQSTRGAHQGVIATAAPFRFTPLHEALHPVATAEQALVIVLDHVTDPGNLGAIVRTAEVVGAACVLVASRRSAAVTPAAWKASAGALAHVPVVCEVNLARALEQLKDAGFWVAGAFEHAEENVWEAPLTGRIALVVGSEGSGLSRLTRERCDFLVRLPQAGQVGSLNVAQATTAVAYEWLRRSWADAAGAGASAGAGGAANADSAGTAGTDSAGHQ